MLYNVLFLVKDIVIVLMAFAIIAALRKIRELQQKLAEEKRKQSMPLLALKVNTDDDFGIFLTNDSYCYARHIRIDDLDVVVDYGFKKHIRLKFDTVEMLKPNGQTRLAYRVFDGDFDTTATDAKNILNHFHDAPLEMRLRYENLEGNPFTATIVSENDYYVIKDIVSLEKESR